MKRLVALLAGLVMVPLVGFVPPAGAVGLAPCAITGTISFTPPAAVAASGTWRIAPAAITCYGIHQGPEYFLGQGQFSGSGTYTVVPSGAGSCLTQVGRGTVEYRIPTSGPGPVLSVREESTFILAGIGKFTTPSLRGPFVVTPPYEGDCVTKPVTRATFVADVLLVRDLPNHRSPNAHDRDLPRHEG